MKKEPTPPTAVIVGDTEHIFALPCACEDSVFMRTSICLTTALRKLRSAYAFIDNAYESDVNPRTRQARNYALEELSDLETLLEFCETNGYYLMKRE